MIQESKGVLLALEEQANTIMGTRF